MPLARTQHFDEEDPIGFAIVLEDYATVLDKLPAHSEAERQRADAQRIRNANPGKEPKSKPEYYPSPLS